MKGKTFGHRIYAKLIDEGVWTAYMCFLGPVTTISAVQMSSAIIFSEEKIIDKLMFSLNMIGKYIWTQIKLLQGL